MEGKRKETHREGGSKQGKERGEDKKMKRKRGRHTEGGWEGAREKKGGIQGNGRKDIIYRDV